MRYGKRFCTYGIPLAFTLALTLALPLPAVAVRGPVPVSPGAQTASAAVESRCPTFQWAGVPTARGYEVAVFRVEGAGAEPVLATRASVLGDARGWTPSASDCLERGGRYAWSVAALAGKGEELAWSPPFLFEVEAAPSLDELEQAIATIERYRTHGGGDPPARPDRAARDEALAEDGARPVLARRPRSGVAQAGGFGDALPGTLTAPTSGITRIASEANTPTLGTPSLRVSANIALNAASNLFKFDVLEGDDVVFLWDDTVGNTALGREALSLVSGNASNNTAVGRRALQNTTGGATTILGSFNTAIGDGALQENTTGHSNTASGYAALLFNTIGHSNTASGYQALYSNTSGNQNTASGHLALVANSTGSKNTAIGYRALTSNTFRSSNTAVGYLAMEANTGGSNNTAVGSLAMEGNTDGDKNTAVGNRALHSNTDGRDNTATGYGALLNNATGNYNTASGLFALDFNTTGSFNTASGSVALRYNTTGARNTAVGRSAGLNATTGDDNIFLGSGAKGVAGEGHTIRIGGTTTGGGSPGEGEQNRIFVNGIRGITTLVDNAVPVLISLTTGQLGTESSSRAVKQDIHDLGPLADRLLDLRPVAFRYRQHAASDPDTPLHFGLIAEEVAEVFPELVVFGEDGKPETIKYHLLSSLLLGEVQRQNELVLEQRAEIQRINARLEAVENQDRHAEKHDGDR